MYPDAFIAEFRKQFGAIRTGVLMRQRSSSAPVAMEIMYAKAPALALARDMQTAVQAPPPLTRITAGHPVPPLMGIGHSAFSPYWVPHPYQFAPHIQPYTALSVTRPANNSTIHSNDTPSENTSAASTSPRLAVRRRGHAISCPAPLDPPPTA
jgi:hypothetical protein